MPVGRHPDPGTLYDAVVIGAGFSGLAAAVRFASLGRKVCLLERHTIPGGLNSYYSLGGRVYDVGLHALTNYNTGDARAPLRRALRRLGLEVADLGLDPQTTSRIALGEAELVFSNDPAFLEDGIAARYPAEVDGYRRMVQALPGYADAAEMAGRGGAREFLARYLHSDTLRELLLMPPMLYGSPSEDDMDFGVFAALFRAIFLEGLCRPRGGIRTLIRLLLRRLREEGGESYFGCGVRRFEVEDGRISALVLDDGTTLQARRVLSSIGLHETLALAGTATPTGAAGRISFAETFTVFSGTPADFAWKDGVVFFSRGPRFIYHKPDGLVEPASGVICIPENFGPSEGRQEGPQKGRRPEASLRITCLANHENWTRLSEDDYRLEKQRCFAEMRRVALDFLARPGAGVLEARTLATDMFTPRTIVKYTGHFAGSVYGTPAKSWKGVTPFANLRVCGTDQGGLGVVGAVISGLWSADLMALSKT